MNDRNDEPRCSFCGRPQSEVQKLIAGPGVYICDECVAVAQHIMEEEKAEETPDFQLKDLPTPHEIKLPLMNTSSARKQPRRPFPLQCTTTTSGSRPISAPLMMM